MMEINESREKLKEYKDQIFELKDQLGNIIIGQKYFIDGLLIALFADGHLLVEGIPGLGKTLAVNTLSNLIKGEFSRIQFTPDLMPHDVVGVEYYIKETGKLEFRKGAIFANFVLADEINRSPAKVQSALLESMQERQVTVSGQTYKLPDVFLVLATENPEEQQGVYAVSETALDRFMMRIDISYPSSEAEHRIAVEDFEARSKQLEPIMELEDILNIRQAIKDGVYLADSIFEYAVRLSNETRKDEYKKIIGLGASPRASQNFIKASKVRAFLNGRFYVIPEDIKSVGRDILRHRILLTRSAKIKTSSNDIIDEIFLKVPIS